MIGTLEKHKTAGVCEWRLDDDPDFPTWHTECGNAHEFMHGGPTDNFYTYCPYCGRLLSEKEPVIPDEEAPID